MSKKADEISGGAKQGEESFAEQAKRCLSDKGGRLDELFGEDVKIPLLQRQAVAAMVGGSSDNNDNEADDDGLVDDSPLSKEQQAFFLSVLGVGGKAPKKK